MRFLTPISGLIIVAGLMLGPPPGHTDDKPQTALKTVKPLSSDVEQGLKWLADHQLESGAWGEGETRRGSASAARANVGDTCTAALALLRSGNSPTRGKYKRNVLRAIGYVLGQVEQSDGKTLSVTSVKGTRLQSKLGPFIDTFLTSMVLAQVKGHMPNHAENQRVDRALGKVIAKIEKNQKKDGTWSNRGWAAALSQAMATKGLNWAAQNGAKVDGEVLERAESFARKSFDRVNGRFARRGTAGVALYGAASGMTALTESSSTRSMKREGLKRVANSPTAKPAAREEARQKLETGRQVQQDRKAAADAVTARLGDAAFVKGFGSNGGEEFLSYMAISESLMVEGGDAWATWDKAMSENLGRVQNKDGSWTGHHCITGRTFCTAAALLVLTADRAPVPVTAGLL